MKTFKQWILEGRAFEYGGSKYSSGFGSYTKDGKSISKEEYQKASDARKGEGIINPSKQTLKAKKQSTPKNTTTKSKTASLISQHPHREGKTVKEIEQIITEFSGLNCNFKGISNKKFLNDAGKVLHTVLTKYPYLGDSNNLNHFATPEGLIKQADDKNKDTFESKEFDELLETKWNELLLKGYAKEGNWLNQDLLRLGMNSKGIKSFCEKHGLDSVWSKVNENNRKYIKEEYLIRQKKAYRDSVAKSQSPMFKKYGDAYAFHTSNKSQGGKWAGVYFVAKNIRHVEENYSKSVASGFFPKNTTYTALVYHELAHAMTDMLGLASNERLQELSKTSWMNVSRYAATDVCEFISEAFAEYMDSPAPRETAMEVGTIIDETYKEYAERKDKE